MGLRTRRRGRGGKGEGGGARSRGELTLPLRSRIATAERSRSVDGSLASISWACELQKSELTKGSHDGRWEGVAGVG